MKIDKRCVICGGKYGKTLLTIVKPDRFERFVGIKERGYQRKWIECSVCGLAINVHNSRDRLLLREIEAAYCKIDFESLSIGAKFNRILELPLEMSDNAQRIERVRLFMKNWLKKDFPNRANFRKIVDIGAGTGVFLARFLKINEKDNLKWKGFAIESDPLACKHLKSLNCFEVLEGIFPGDFRLKNFDLCTMNKIVEHIADPVKFLKKTASILKKRNGVVYIEVPDKLTINSRPSSDNILGALHYHLYDPKSLMYLLNAAGLVVIQVMRLPEPSGKITVAAFAALPSAVNYMVA